MKIEDFYKDAKLIGWAPDETIKHLYKMCEYFSKLNFSHNSRENINTEVLGMIRQAIYTIVNLMCENAKLKEQYQKMVNLTTPSNEPLTCDECYYIKNDEYSPCAWCIRSKENEDYYCRPQGEKHET